MTHNEEQEMLIYQTSKGQKHTVYVYLKDGRVERFKMNTIF